MVHPLSLNAPRPKETTPVQQHDNNNNSDSDALDVWCSTEEPIQWTLMRPSTRHSDPSASQPPPPPQQQPNHNVVNRLCFDSCEMGSESVHSATVAAPPLAQRELKDRATELLQRLRALQATPVTSWSFHSANTPSEVVRGGLADSYPAEERHCTPSVEDTVRVEEEPFTRTVASTNVPSTAPNLERQGTPLPWPTAPHRQGRLGPHVAAPPPAAPPEEEEDKVSIYSCNFQSILPSANASGGRARYPAGSSYSMTTDTEDYSQHTGSNSRRDKNSSRYVYDPVLRCFLDKEENAFLETIDF
ncbi:hypothetical protein AGDE_13762 [Angomonas deanei]|nr:hypothetical protein AGDE_13762 [Angomonas deanei]|eukprot:EPY21833.1 hypothetical protein AGDE_13762 [Angomonas deanei]